MNGKTKKEKRLYDQAFIERTLYRLTVDGGNVQKKNSKASFNNLLTMGKRLYHN